MSYKFSLIPSPKTAAICEETFKKFDCNIKSVTAIRNRDLNYFDANRILIKSRWVNQDSTTYLKMVRVFLSQNLKKGAWKHFKKNVSMIYIRDHTIILPD